MPLYLVRWQNLSVSLVKARDKTRLLDILDEVDNPVECKIEVYKGPLFISLDLDVGHTVSDQGVDPLQDVSHCLEDASFKISEDSGDTIDDMISEVVKIAFPFYYQYLEEYQDKRDRENEPKPERPDAEDEFLCKEALIRELGWPVETRTKRLVEQRVRLADAYRLLSSDDGGKSAESEDGH